MPMQALSYRHRKQLRVLHELYDLAWFQSTIIMFTILATPEGHISCLPRLHFVLCDCFFNASLPGVALCLET